ncbi:elongator complex protein 5-like [Halichondria panicea]|uniref:elongator complex protein 5-like n=1 Tax=Halichondria panicea TaxID=6063 RepID=UPI00312B848A
MAAKESSLLEALRGGSELTDSVIIQDCVEVSGRPLLKSLVHRYSQQSPVHLFLLESGRQDWEHCSTGKQLFYHDYYTDPLGWDHDDDITTTTTTGASHTSKRCLHGLTVQSCVGDVEGVRSVEDVRSVDDVRGVVVFDCLSMLLLTQSASSVSRLLHGLGHHCLLVLSLVHADLHEDHVISQLSHVTSTVVSMQTPPPLTDYLCSVYHRRKSGKISKQVESFTISADYSTLSSSLHRPHTHSTLSTTHTTPSQAADPTANLTFDLTLTAKEKHDRANVVLPYTRPHITAHTHPHITSDTRPHISLGKGEIFYQPDEADDFDESDPDDDLDI